MTSVLYALGTFVSQAPWFFISTIPFRGFERIKKKWIMIILLALAFLRAAIGFAFLTWIPNWFDLLDYAFIIQPIFLTIVFSFLYKVHIIKIIYIQLLIVSISIPLNMLGGLLAFPFITLSTEFDVIMDATPVWILIMAILIAIITPFIYRLFNTILRDALAEFTGKTVLYMCATSGLFFVFYTYSLFAVPYVNGFFLLITPVEAVFCTYINLRMILNLNELTQYKLDAQIQEVKNEYLLENYRTLENHYKQISETKHEMRHHLFAAQTLLNNGEYEQLNSYLSHIEEYFPEAANSIPCENLVIQAILNHADQRAKELGFTIQFEILPLPELPIPDADLVSLFMNLLENALESCEKIAEAKDRWIQVKLKTHQSYLCLSISNARCGQLIINDDSYTSTKDATLLHGHGIAVVRKIVDKYNGIISFEHSDDSFSVEIALPVIESIK